MQKHSYWKILALVVLAGLMSASAARADVLSLPSIGNWTVVGMNTGSTYGGSPNGATLNSQKLSFLFCLEFDVNVYVPDTYGSSVVTHDGTLHGGPGLTATKSDQVAWLLDHYAWNPVATWKSEEAIALQAAIWNVLDGSKILTIGPTELYTGMINSLAARSASDHGNVARYSWISPQKIASVNPHYQGLVTAVPEAGGILLLSIGVAAVGLGRKLTKA